MTTAPDWLIRSALFVPGDDDRKLARATTAGADALIYDLEDAVAAERKADARQRVCAALAGPGPALRLVRVNALDTPWGAQDIRAVGAAGAHGVLIPKCDSPDALQQADALLAGSATRLVALIETPAGVFDLPALTAASPRLAALGFGHADFSHAAGLPDMRSDAGLVWHARAQIALAAKARGLLALDCVGLEVRDEAAFRADAALGRGLGYDGKLCIHPMQVAVVNALYAPDDATIAHAHRVLAAWDAARAQGQAVIAVDGRMVDAPVVAAARRTLARAGLES
ncbi:MAG: CoA ester lyase [Immundisolibacter sp.]|uniref:HpcH/HpaI aldolase/citrate lyase family protein n=1 Tax=Immundisolibacter sp. TaxID=1934948 RepID=UPI003D0FA294